MEQDIQHAGTRWCQYCIGIPLQTILENHVETDFFEVLVVGGTRYLRRFPGV
jgi:hypothetical protein